MSNTSGSDKPVFYPAVQIADYFIERSASFTLFHILKLAYIAHGVHLAYVKDSKGIFTEQVEAWQYGPVIPSIYHAFKHNGANLIKKPDTNSKADEIDEKTREVLDAVFKKYHKTSGPGLVELTHQKGTPWHKVWEEEDGKDKYHAIIDTEDIKKYYKAWLDMPPSSKGK